MVLQDVASEEMYNLGKWHIFFPSEVCFGFYISLGHEVLHTTRALNWHIPAYHFAFVFARFASIYDYDFKLFQQRFLGEEGVA